MSKWIKIEDKTINTDNIDYFEWQEIFESGREGLITLKIWFGNGHYVGIIIKESLVEYTETIIKSR
jgi:hypothetical protein